MQPYNNCVFADPERLGRQRALLTCLVVSFLLLTPRPADSGAPVHVRFLGKLYLVPTGEPGRHGDLLALRISQKEEVEEQIVYLQVDEFHSSSKAQSEFSLLQDIRDVQPYVRVLNGQLLVPLLREKNLRKSIMVGGLFYRSAGRLAILTAHLETEKECSPQPKQKQKQHYW